MGNVKTSYTSYSRRAAASYLAEVIISATLALLVMTALHVVPETTIGTAVVTTTLFATPLARPLINAALDYICAATMLAALCTVPSLATGAVTATATIIAVPICLLIMAAFVNYLCFTAATMNESKRPMSPSKRNQTTRGPAFAMTDHLSSDLELRFRQLYNHTCGASRRQQPWPCSTWLPRLTLQCITLAIALYLSLGVPLVRLGTPGASQSSVYCTAGMGLTDWAPTTTWTSPIVSKCRSPSGLGHKPSIMSQFEAPRPQISAGDTYHRLTNLVPATTYCAAGVGLTNWASPEHHARCLMARAMSVTGNGETGSTTEDSELILIVDSGASFHIHNRESDLVNIRPCSSVFHGMDRVKHRATCIGDMHIKCFDQHNELVGLKISDVRVFPNVKDSLLSVSQLWTQGKVQVLFGADNVIILNGKGDGQSLSLPIVERNGIFEWLVHPDARRPNGRPPKNSCYNHRPGRACFGSGATIRSTKSHTYFNEYSPNIAAHHMHNRLHAGVDRLRNLPAITADAPPNLAQCGAVRCEHCAIANSSRHGHTSSKYSPSYPGRLIHADVAGDFVPTKGGQNKFVLVLVDDHSRFKFAYPIRRRQDAPAQLRRFVASFNAMARNTQHQGHGLRTIGSLQHDKAGEFISREFQDFLAGNLVKQITTPAEIKALNGVAERAIRSIMEQMRSMMVASGAPLGFWDYAVIMATDILNRTTCPPHSEHSCYEMFSGEKPRILNILPFGCRMFAVRAKQGAHKSTHYPRAYSGINLGRSVDCQGAYCVWVPDEGKVVTTSEVYHDETLMPWRPAGSQRVSDPAPVPAVVDDQPVTLPLGADPGAPVPPLNSLAEEFRRLATENSTTGGPITPQHGPASLSRHVLVLFSGPKDRPDGLMTFLRRLGFTVSALDNDPKNGGGTDDDILRDPVYEKLLRDAQRGEYFAIFAAPPCSTFSVARLIRSTQSEDGGPPLVRSRTEIRGVTGIPAKHRRELQNANTIITRTTSILGAAADSGAEFIIENPADRGDPSDETLFIHSDHGPLWLYPEIMSLEKTWHCRKCTFPQCAFGAQVLKYTTLMYTPGMDKTLGDFNRLKCEHSSHAEKAGGSRRADGTWNSADKAAYPADLNLALAQSIAVVAGTQKSMTLKLPLPSDSALADTDGSPSHEASANGGANASFEETSPLIREVLSQAGGTMKPIDKEDPDALEEQEGLSDQPTPVLSEYTSSRPEDNGGESMQPDAPLQKDPDGPVSHRLRSRILLSVGTNHSLVVEPSNTDETINDVPALPDPKNRREAMEAPDREGWLEAEKVELKNHERNGSFEVMTRTNFRTQAPGRKLVRLTWAYKRKRSGTLKARLCVQGCSQIPGVDYDQTFCGTMRATSLRLLSALATHLGLLMRRYDFVSAFLQGSLEEGEVIFCEPPPGHDKTAEDGLAPVYKVLKPVYGMAQAGRRWQRSLFPWLLGEGPAEGNLTQSESDPSVFYSRRATKTPGGKRDETLIVGVYVDDLFILFSHSDTWSLYLRFIKVLTKRWDVEDEGAVSDLLNVEITRSNSGHVTLRQTAYIDKLIATHAPEGVPSTSQRNKTPCDPTLAQSVLDAVCSEDPTDQALRSKYMSLVGALLYCATHTRPDIAYSVSQLSRAMHCPNPVLLEGAFRVLYYLYRTRMLGLRYTPNTDANFHGMSDADWAVKHSTSGAVFMLSGAAISWSSKRQVSIALSSCEAEIMAASEAAKEAVYLGGFLKEFGQACGDGPPKLFIDNTAARDLAYNPQHHERTKHIARRHFFIREMVEAGRLVVPYVRSTDNLADFFTKPLPSSVFFAMRDKIMNIKEDDSTQD